MVGVVLAGALAGATVPRAVALRDRLAVEQAAAQLVESVRRARHAAFLAHAAAALRITPDTIALDLVEGPDTTAAWRDPGPVAAGVRLAASGTIVFTPNGLGLGPSNRRYDLSRGTVRRTLVVSRLGRVRVERQPRRARPSARTRRPPAP